MEKFLFSQMYLYRYLIETLIVTVKFLSNNKILDTELFFFISDLPKFVKGNKTMYFKQANMFSTMLATDFSTYQCGVR